MLIATIKLGRGARYTLPAGPASVNRVLYGISGEATIAGVSLAQATAAQLRPESEVALEGGAHGGELLLLQGRPIAEPVVQHGPFVMNTRAEIQQAVVDYHRTQFGGWPWESDGPAHAREKGRFAIHADGRVETPA